VSLQSPALLAVFAHPDDESFRSGGTLALLACRGVRVQVLTATRGEAGSCGDPPLCRPEELAGVREQELRCACAALGIAPPILLDYRDGELATVDEDEGAARVGAVMRQVRPDALLTWPPDGLSGHPDHIAVSRWTVLAFQQAAAPGRDGPRLLYYMAIPVSLQQALGLNQLSAIDDAGITLAVDVLPVWERKLAAIRCHRTQLGQSPILAADPERQRRFLGQEHFRRAAGDEAADWLTALLGEAYG
jgi:LmbE family N-acetylglucosaminyl deacetylase